MAADVLGTGVGAALTPQAQPDKGRAEQFIGETEVGHADDALGIENIVATDNRTAVAAGEAGLALNTDPFFEIRYSEFVPSLPESLQKQPKNME